MADDAVKTAGGQVFIVRDDKASDRSPARRCRCRPMPRT
jgi:hypothetical protein